MADLELDGDPRKEMAEVIPQELLSRDGSVALSAWLSLRGFVCEYTRRVCQGIGRVEGIYGFRRVVVVGEGMWRVVPCIDGYLR